MKIIKTEGCTAFDFTFDGISESDLTKEETNKITEFLIEKLREHLKDDSIRLMDLVEIFQYDDYEYDNDPCGQCGDTVSTTTWIL